MVAAKHSSLGFRACFQNQKMNTIAISGVYDGSSFYENILAVSGVGSALGADKKINLASWIYVIVCAPTAAWSSAQGRSVDVRSHGLHLAHRHSLARLACPLRALELGLYALASLVPAWTVAAVVGCTGAERSRQIALSRRQPCQSTSRRQQSRRWPTKSGHWTHQRWAEHQDQCVGGRARTSGEFELGPRTARRCVRRADCGTSAIAWYDYGGRQGLRQRWFSRAVAALGQSPLHSTSLQPTQTCGLASWSLQETAQGGKLVSTIETLSQNWDSL